VTLVRADASWWNGERPADLNARQRINANLVRAVLATVDWAEWVFHIDSDEVVQVDRAVLARVPADVRVVWLAPLEVVSRKRWDAEPTWFKRLLNKPDLVLLQVLGVIDRPANVAYFNSHVEGKSGIRPALDVWLTLHHAVDAEDNELPAHSDRRRLRVLHYESTTHVEFVRKWTAKFAAGPVNSLRPVREQTAVALQTLLDKELSDERRAAYLMRIYERCREDDLDLLRDLGLLEEVDPRAGTHVPAPLPAGAREWLDAMFERLRGEPKQIFHPGEPVGPVATIIERAAS
jgi:hypothetical protein